MLTAWEERAILIVAMSLFAVLPIQAVLEGGYWLRSGEWFGANLSWLLGSKVSDTMTSTGWLGLDFLSEHALRIWIGLPSAVLGLALLKLAELLERKS